MSNKSKKIPQTIIDQCVEAMIHCQDHRAILRDYMTKIARNDMEDIEGIINATSRNYNNSFSGVAAWFFNDIISKLDPIDRLLFTNLSHKGVKNEYGSYSKNTIIEAVDKEYWRFVKGIKEEYGDDPELLEKWLRRNAFASISKRISGGLYSSFGKIMEIPLMNKLLDMVNVPKSQYANQNKLKGEWATHNNNVNLTAQQIDFYLQPLTNTLPIRIEIKLNGKGNPESTTAALTGNTDLIIAENISDNKIAQLIQNKVEYLKLFENKNITDDFKRCLTNLKVIDVGNKINIEADDEKEVKYKTNKREEKR